MIAALAPRFLENELETELQIRNIPVVARSGRLFLCDVAEDSGLIWVDDVWKDVQEVPIDSISHGGRILQQWRIPFVNGSQENFCRAELILESIKRFPITRLRFGQPLPQGPWGVLALPHPKCMWVSTQPRARVPLGCAEFYENRTEPPSRAYLKLWELMIVHGIQVQGPRVVDLGAAFGDWTWVLLHMGLEVIAVDKSALADTVARHPRVRVLRESAFGLDPCTFDSVDTVFSDVICYPSRALKLVQKWIHAGVRQIVCTVKFQGTTDWESIDAFRLIPDPQLIHQYANKHELTWV